jgi:hypothetical protein
MTRCAAGPAPIGETSSRRIRIHWLAEAWFRDMAPFLGAPGVWDCSGCSGGAVGTRGEAMAFH